MGPARPGGDLPPQHLGRHPLRAGQGRLAAAGGARRSRTWWRDRGWLGWQETFGQYVEPTQQDLARIPFLRASLLVEAPVPLDDLPPEPEGPHEEVERRAHRAVTVLARELNALVSPVLDQLGPMY